MNIGLARPLLWLAVASVIPAGAVGQQTIDISGAATCAGCRLELRRIAVFGTAEGAGTLTSDPTTVVQDARGNYYVTQWLERTRILVFNREGRFVRAIGRAGGGPGEYRRIAFVLVGAGDSLYVFDEGNQRIQVLAPDYTPARVAAISGQFFAALPLGGRRVIANGHVRERVHLGQPLQTLDLDGRLLAVYGAKTPDFRPDVPYSVMRTVARASENSAWSGYKTRYTIEEWRFDGTQARVLARTVPWFKPYDRRRPSTQSQPREPWLTALNQDAGGLLWTVISVPAEDWARIWTERGADEKKGLSSDQHSTDTMIEVIDLDRKAVLVSQRLPQYLQGFVNDSTVYTYHVDADEVPHIEIWRLNLLRPRAGR